MDNSNKAIARRINKELKNRDWSQADLLRKIILFKNPNIDKRKLHAEGMKKKGNFSTSLKGKEDRSISKEDLYVIAKVFGLPLEYLWFGDEKKSGFVPKGARYAAYQDSDSEYRSYIADLDYEDRVQHPDELGFNLFDYFGQFDSINGYRFFEKNYSLFFDYSRYGRLMYVNSEGREQFCSTSENENLISDNLISTLVKYDDVKTFKKIYFDNSPLNRFNPDQPYHQNKSLFGDSFLETLLQNESFLDLTLKTKELELNALSKYCEKGQKRIFVEPMFYEALSYALQHEKQYEKQLFKMLRFALEFNKNQYEFVYGYLKTNNNEYGDVQINEYAPRFLRSSRNVAMGSVIRLRETVSNDELKKLLNEIEQYVFNMTHIINKQEKSNEEIKISTPDNSLFLELHRNAIEQNVDYVPFVVHSDKEFTYFKYYESMPINYESLNHLSRIVDCLDKVQKLVSPKTNNVLVHGNFDGPVLMIADGKVVGLAGWQKCRYGSKYEDRAELLSNIDAFSYRGEYLEKYKEIFDIISQDFSQEEKRKLIDKALDVLNEKMKTALEEEKDGVSTAYRFKERSSKLEFFKEIYLAK